MCNGLGERFDSSIALAAKRVDVGQRVGAGTGVREKLLEPWDHCHRPTTVVCLCRVKSQVRQELWVVGVIRHLHLEQVTRRLVFLLGLFGLLETQIEIAEVCLVHGILRVQPHREQIILFGSFPSFRVVREKVGGRQIRCQARAADRFRKALVDFDCGIDLAHLETISSELFPGHGNVRGGHLRRLPVRVTRLFVLAAVGEEIAKHIPVDPVIRPQ